MPVIKSRQSAYNQYMLMEGSAKNTLIKDYIYGYEFQMRIPGYKSLYLSEFERFDLFLDGQPVPQENITFILYNKRFRLDELAPAYFEHWYVLDSATIEIYKEGGLKGKHTLYLDVDLRSPYSVDSGKSPVSSSDFEREFDFGE